MTEFTSFGALLKRYRQSARISQDVLAARSGLSPRAISDLERGVNRKPRYDTLKLILDVLPLSIQQREKLIAAAYPEQTLPTKLHAPPSAALMFVVAGQAVILGHMSLQQGRNALAKKHFHEALASYSTNTVPNFIAWCLEGVAAAVCSEERFTIAARLCAAAASFREQDHTPLPLSEQVPFDRMVDRIRVALGESVFKAEWASGNACTRAEAIECALQAVETIHL